MAITEEDLTREKIIELAKLHPVVAHYLTLWQMKRLTWEQASYGIILALIERNTSLTKDMLTLRTTSFTPFVKVDEIPNDMLSQSANLLERKLLFSPISDQLRIV